MLELPTNVSTLKQFLLLPEFKPALEFIGGRMIQKISPLLPHSVIQYWLTNALNSYAIPRRLGQAYTELRVVFGGTARVPDISFYVAARSPKYTRRSKAPRILLAPDLVVEILSQGQPDSELRRKIRLSVRHGSSMGWLIHPRLERIGVLRPGQKVQALNVGDSLDGEGVLAGFSLPLEEIFGWFDRY